MRIDDTHLRGCNHPHDVRALIAHNPLRHCAVTDERGVARLRLVGKKVVAAKPLKVGRQARLLFRAGTSPRHSRLKWN